MDRLAAALSKATQVEALRSRLATQGVELRTGDGAAMRALLVRDTEEWGEVIRSAGIKAE